jgi:uncharacterized membrane protein
MISIDHVHPALVHFPIVLLLLAVVLDLAVLVRKGDLTARDCLATTASGALVLGAIAAAVAAYFGDVALDIAMTKGFPGDALERHEELGVATLSIFAVLAVLRLALRWQRIPLAGLRGWVVFALGAAGAGVLLTAAYYGGDLVYGLGVNVVPATP